LNLQFCHIPSSCSNSFIFTKPILIQIRLDYKSLCLSQPLQHLDFCPSPRLSLPMAQLVASSLMASCKWSQLLFLSCTHKLFSSYTGYSPSFQFQNPPPTVVGWSIPGDLSNGFIAPSQYTNPDIICHVGATNAGASAVVTAGSKVQLQWTPWPESHKGPVMDYLAPCNGACQTVDKTSLKFFKIDEVGLINGAVAPGTWASDQMIANNNTWEVTIPASIAPGNYVLRHETIALHAAGQADGAQNYPQCINLIVKSSGTATPAGVAATSFYTPTDPGILVNIYQSLASYAIPGPALFAAGATATPTTKATTAAPAASASPAPIVATTSAVAAQPTTAPAATTLGTNSQPIRGGNGRGGIRGNKRFPVRRHARDVSV
jgi:cellulase